ncbi:hypothetical protein ABID26_003347 [Mesorhizobium shonense]|uniref:Uncharacterized protein n=1 Tax=Mesorhizobium shonense TaxID=1209948 RepID=A0ABV2HTK5_9HYPH
MALSIVTQRLLRRHPAMMHQQYRREADFVNISFRETGRFRFEPADRSQHGRQTEFP